MSQWHKLKINCNLWYISIYFEAMNFCRQQSDYMFSILIQQVESARGCDGTVPRSIDVVCALGMKPRPKHNLIPVL